MAVYYRSKAVHLLWFFLVLVKLTSISVLSTPFMCADNFMFTLVYYMQYTAIFHGRKIDYFPMKNCHIFRIFAKNMDCGYTLEPPH